MKIIVTKEDLEQVESAVNAGCVGGMVYDQMSFDLWGKIRLCIEKDLQLEYHEEWGESDALALHWLHTE